MVRLTADLVFSSPHFFNPIRQRELDLRGNKIPAIENLGATEDQFDSIDLSDNEIVKLEGFPLLKRIRTLLLNNNRITRISRSCASQLPNLTTLVLSNNRLINLPDLDPLGSLVKLETLSLLDNVVAKKPKYRLYVAHLLPRLKLLDFRKVSQRERKEAKVAFVKGKEKKAEGQTSKGSAPGPNVFVPGEALEGLKGAGGTERGKEKGEGEGSAMETDEETRQGEGEEEKGAGGAGGEEGGPKKGPTPEQITAIKAAIATAQTLEEVARLEKALQSGHLPSELGSAVGADAA